MAEHLRLQRKRKALLWIALSVLAFTTHGTPSAQAVGPVRTLVNHIVWGIQGSGRPTAPGDPIISRSIKNNRSITVETMPHSRNVPDRLRNQLRHQANRFYRKFLFQGNEELSEKIERAELDPTSSTFIAPEGAQVRGAPTAAAESPVPPEAQSWIPRLAQRARDSLSGKKGGAGAFDILSRGKVRRQEQIHWLDAEDRKQKRDEAARQAQAAQGLAGSPRAGPAPPPPGPGGSAANSTVSTHAIVHPPPKPPRMTVPGTTNSPLGNSPSTPKFYPTKLPGIDAAQANRLPPGSGPAYNEALNPFSEEPTSSGRKPDGLRQEYRKMTGSSEGPAYPAGLSPFDENTDEYPAANNPFGSPSE